MTQQTMYPIPPRQWARLARLHESAPVDTAKPLPPAHTTQATLQPKAHGPKLMAHGSDGVTLLEHVELIEAVVPSTADSVTSNGRHVVEVTLIRSGDSKMGNHYPPDVLERAVPLFEGAVAFADHGRDPNLPERSVRDLVGYYRRVRAVREAGRETRLRAWLHLLPGTDWLFNLLRETEMNPSLCGLSIDALGKLDESASSRERRVIEEIRQVYSIDVVTRPSAGGQVVRVLQSDRTHSDQHHIKEQFMEPTSAFPVNQAPAGTPAGESVMRVSKAQGNEAPDLARLVEQLSREREAAQQELRRITQLLTPDSAAADASAGDVAHMVEEFKREQQLTKSEGALREALSASSLPIPVQDKLRRRFGKQIFESAALEAAITEERAVLAALSATGEIRGMGYEKHLAVGMNEYERLQSAFDKMFDIAESDAARSVPGFSGIREAFYISTGHDIGSTGGADRPLRESFAEGLRNYVRAAGGRLQESEVLLREADVATASFSYLLGTSMNKRLLKDYQAWPSEWQKFATITRLDRAVLLVAPQTAVNP